MDSGLAPSGASPMCNCTSGNDNTKSTWRVRSRGDLSFALRVCFCDDPSRPDITRSPWRYSFGRTANIATRTCRRTRWKRASALTSARSARTAPKTGFITSARTAAAVLSRGQSGRRRSGGLDYRLRSGRRRTSGCICPTVSTRSPSSRRAFGIFRQRNVELPSRHSGAMRSIEPGISRFRVHRCAMPRNDAESANSATTACSDRTAFPVPSSNRRSRPVASGSWPRAR
jgi:hypothetical protein